MYEPKLGRFLSRDPLPENGVELLYPVPEMTRYAYVRNNPAKQDDPSGMQAGGTCKVELRCIRLGFPFIGPRHCGLTISDSKGTEKFHVVGKGDCSLTDDEPRFGPLTSYTTPVTWSNLDEKVCQCIRSTAALINVEAKKGKLPYTAVPAKACGKFGSTCNSNYITKCLLQHCGLIDDVSWGWGATPYGWDHRMTKCLEWHYEEHTVTSKGERWTICECVCDVEENIDDAWCAPSL